MTCESVRESIHGAFDADPAAPLEDALSAETRGHLAACDACREMWDELLAVRSALHALPRVPLPPAALDAVWAATVRPIRHQRSGLWRAAAAAVVVTVLGGGTLYFVATAKRPGGPSQAELAHAEAQADLVFGYTARALAATRDAATHHVIEEKISPAVRGGTSPRPTRRSS
jgi:predicted anti-sigma-YlaC factor YlaD